MFELSKSESLCDVSVTRTSDTLSYGFPQTVLVESSIQRTLCLKMSEKVFLPLLSFPYNRDFFA